MDQGIISGMKKNITEVTEANEFSQHTFKNTQCYIKKFVRDYSGVLKSELAPRAHQLCTRQKTEPRKKSGKQWNPILLPHKFHRVNSLRHPCYFSWVLFILIAKDVLEPTRKQRHCVSSFRSSCH